MLARMTSRESRLISSSILILGGLIAVGLNDLATATGTGTLPDASAVLGMWTFALGALMFLVEYARSFRKG